MTTTPYTIDYSQRDARSAEVDEIFFKRWSPRSFKKVAIEENTQRAIFDAMRFTPSAYNEQPWRVLVSTDETFDAFLGLLVDSNQTWAKNASLLGFMIAHRFLKKNGKENPCARYDCGAAWMAMTLQARKFGLYTHGMAGIHYDKIYTHFDIPQDTYEVVAGFSIGVLDDVEKLPEEWRAFEKPSGRKSLDEICFFGGGKFS